MSKLIYLIFPDGQKLLCERTHLPLNRPLDDYFKEIPEAEKLKLWRKGELR
jgi:hypothetical protein